jgi:hypothetical protein
MLSLKNVPSGPDVSFQSQSLYIKEKDPLENVSFEKGQQRGHTLEISLNKQQDEFGNM